MATAQSILAGTTVQVTKYTLAQPYIGVTPLVSGSGNVANAVATATLTPTATTIAYLAGFVVTGAGASASKAVQVSVTGLLGGTRQFIYSFGQEPTVANQPLNLHFDPPLQAAAVNTPIVVSCPASGLGGTSNTVMSWGFATTLPDPSLVP